MKRTFIRSAAETVEESTPHAKTRAREQATRVLGNIKKRKAATERMVFTAHREERLRKQTGEVDLEVFVGLVRWEPVPFVSITYRKPPVNVRSPRSQIVMPAANLLTLIDDIATILDDVAVLSKVAAKKTAGVLGDDLALNAQQVSGVNSNREIPVVWAVAKGSAINKAILVPMALTISYFAPWAVLPLLMIGGIFLCYEGVEKLWHSYCGGHDAEDEAHESKLHEAVKTESIDLMALEKDKIKGPYAPTSCSPRRLLSSRWERSQKKFF